LPSLCDAYQDGLGTLESVEGELSLSTVLENAAFKLDDEAEDLTLPARCSELSYLIADLPGKG